MPIPAEFAPMLGPAAAVGTSVLWTCSTLLFSTASRRLGATIVNVVRIWLALVFVVIAQRLIGGSWLPTGDPTQFAWLIASGFLGVCIGDQALLSAYVLIGPRLSAMVTTTAPLMAAAFGIAMLGERISPIAGVGMIMTLGGVVWVVLERSPDATQTTASRRWLGIALATLSAACQAAGMLMSKKGIGHGWLPREQHLDPLAASMIRIAAAAVCVMPLLAIRTMRSKPTAVEHPPGTPSASTAWTCAVIGAVVGPFLGMTLSLVAADLIPIGIAQTLCSLSPIFILPALAFIQRERISIRAVLGAMLSVAGGAMLFLSRP
ncbi:MAG: DMT family transporter [Phycisphaerae bacterium]